ncbi:MAG TPA: tetratricopeptide repeat protein [Planctomycetota bacterium]|nr:tetratricopeptide repeat protein [Planctomycetota bacterium]
MKARPATPLLLLLALCLAPAARAQSAAAPAAALAAHSAAPSGAPPAGRSAPIVEADAEQLARAIAAEESGQWDLARTLYDELALAAPEDFRVALGLSRVHTAQGRPWEAATVLEQASAAHPDSVRLLRAAGDAILAAGSTSMALETYDRALALAPADRGLRCAAAWAAVAGRRSDRLLELLAPVPMDDIPAPLQRALGRAALLGNQPELAVASLEALLAGVAGSPPATSAADVAAAVDALLDLARAHLLLGHDGPALETLRLALAQQPGCAAAYVLLGHLRLRGNQRELALASYEEGIRRGADAAPLAPLLARLRSPDRP